MSRMDVERIAATGRDLGLPTVGGPNAALAQTTATATASVLAFRHAVVSLVASIPDTNGARRYSAEAAAALIELARRGEEQILRQILRPDPAGGDAIWTVACYQIGDLSPTALRDFPEVAPAVATLAQCPEPAHAAAELLACTAAGVRWTAMVRTGDTVRFQLLSNTTASGASSSQPGSLEQACEGWAGQLIDWAARPEADLVVTATSPSPVTAANADDGLSSGALGLALGQILEAVRSLERRVRRPLRRCVGPEPYGRAGAAGQRSAAAGPAGVGGGRRRRCSRRRRLHLLRRPLWSAPSRRKPRHSRSSPPKSVAPPTRPRQSREPCCSPL